MPCAGLRQRLEANFLPNPFYSSAMQRLDAPDWSRLALWDELRRQYLGLEPDPKDRSATRFEHAQALT